MPRDIPAYVRPVEPVLPPMPNPPPCPARLNVLLQGQTLVKALSMAGESQASLARYIAEAGDKKFFPYLVTFVVSGDMLFSQANAALAYRFMLERAWANSKANGILFNALLAIMGAA